jgi:hypothetical protein
MTMKSFLSSILAVATLVATPLTGQSVCPSANDHEGAREIVEFFLNEGWYDEEIAQRGLSAVRFENLRALTDAQDTETCRRLREQITAESLLNPPWKYTFYVADGFYFMVFYKAPIEETRIRIQDGKLYGELYRSPFSVFDSNLNPVLDILI